MWDLQKITVAATFGILSLLAPIANAAQLQALLRTHPPADEHGVVALPREGGTVRLLMRESPGAVSTYAIDLNTREDGNGDGIADNDADNDFHSSFRTGELWQVNVRPAPGETERGIQLRGTSAQGETSDARITITFGIPPPVSPEPRIVADLESLHVGESFTLRVDGAPSDVRTYRWDVQGDGVVDAETAEPFLPIAPDAQGSSPCA